MASKSNKEEFMVENSYNLYVCPKCKGRLQQHPNALYCLACQHTYPFTNNIPDFLFLRPLESSNPVVQGFEKTGKLAWIYETKLWYPIFLKLAGGWHAPTFKDLIAYARKKMLPVKGLVLDVATGTGTYGRRVAGAERTVYGIDLSLDMMHVGQAYVRREGVTNMHFSRADVECLPFGDCLFDGCFTCGSLHLFSDTFKALTEIGRTLKAGAPLIAYTLTWRETGIWEWMHDLLHRWGHLKVFDLPTLQEMLDEAGFVQFEPDTKGGILLFTARKR
jgi:ubiquinone/menaquinone biosynthesis C-methylase UbiE/uncharacterized protein YbaR (Trm112 family)